MNLFAAAVLWQEGGQAKVELGPNSYGFGHADAALEVKTIIQAKIESFTGKSWTCKSLTLPGNRAVIDTSQNRFAQSNKL